MFKANLSSKACVCTFYQQTQTKPSPWREKQEDGQVQMLITIHHETKTPFWAGGGGAGWLDSFEP